MRSAFLSRLGLRLTVVNDSWIGSKIARTIAVAAFLACFASPCLAATVTLDVKGGQDVTFVGAFNRWDEDGNARKPVNPKAKIEKPEADFTAEKGVGTVWKFKNLPPGKYDFVILAGTRTRIEGFYYPSVFEFDPVFPPDATTDDEIREFVLDHIKKSPQYENRVMPLYLGGDEKMVRVLMLLIRDKTTSYEADMAGASTIRHEVWQYTNQHGGWVKERRTRVFDRAILPRDELRKWTWLSEPKLGGIEIGKKPVTIRYTLPKPGDKSVKGLYPY
jgi:hypothetical protein